MPIISNKKFGSVVFHTTVANTIVVMSNTGAAITSNLSIGVEENDIIKGCYISQVWHGGPSTAYWTVKRQDHTNPNANAIVAVFNGTGHTKYNDKAMTIDFTPGYDIILTPVNAANVYIMLELKKITGVP
jgi:hypothetical protein